MCEKKTPFLIAIFSSKVWMESGMLLRLFDVMNLIHVLVLCRPTDVQGRELCVCDFVKNPLTLACIRICTDQCLLKKV